MLHSCSWDGVNLVGYLFEPFASQAHPCTGIDTQTIFNGGRFVRSRRKSRRSSLSMAANSRISVPAAKARPHHLATCARWQGAKYIA